MLMNWGLEPAAPKPPLSHLTSHADHLLFHETLGVCVSGSRVSPFLIRLRFHEVKKRGQGP